MEIKIDNQEIMKAVLIYMALKGFKIDDTMTFRYDHRGKFEGLTLKHVASGKYSIDKIVEYAKED